ncbi:diguanylate cyclase [Halomonas campisalis]|uniref:diguanylate cyclase n=1 Tax=Billgrantia campisalis TaxID=74661 RepID=A0ABS9P814_9GAMM|nr:GGDEF domain-containing protein [Halomonas campisalis]MCG6657352.1 diguanylate cyclase [Halomonas campisalis]MDR5863303.1 diguanylate cyclase [Halomonas campisalis]
MRMGFGLTARLAALTALLTLVILGTIAMALMSFAEYRKELSELSGQHTRALMTASQLIQQSESMVGSGAMLLLADDHLTRRQAMFEINDRKEWIGRLVDELTDMRPADGNFAEINRARDQLVESLEQLDGLVQQRIDLSQRLREAHDPQGVDRLQQIEAQIAYLIRAHRSLSQALGVAVGYHVSRIRTEIRGSADSLSDDIRHRERVLKGFVLVTLLVLIALVLHINRSVVQRIVQLQKVISSERPSPDDLVVDGRDEIARMTGSIQRYVQRINHNEERILAMNRELDFLATHDALTQLNNRHYFERALNERRSEMQRSHYCAVMIDIDRFKVINDVHGHDAGDRVIRYVADCLREGLPETALIARYGGEEFVALAFDMTAPELESLLEAIRQRLESTAIDANGESIVVTASFGLAQKIPDTEFQVCLKAADEALYEAKRQGRNRVVTRRMRAADLGESSDA